MNFLRQKKFIKMSLDLAFIDDLSPTQEHFLKKFLVEACLRQELKYLLQPKCLEYIGVPFRTGLQKNNVQLPLLRYFFSSFVASFPFITMNAEADQISFWRDSVQPFVESFNTKRVSNSTQRRENTTKRHQVNRQLLRTLLLFYNSVLSLKQEVTYLTTDHLKPSDQGKFDKISKAPAQVKVGLDAFHSPEGIDDYLKMAYTNNYNLNIVAVDMFCKRPMGPKSSGWSFNPLRLVTSSKKPELVWHCVFIIQVTKRTLREGKYHYNSHFIGHTYAEFKKLELALKSAFPGLMSTEIHAMPGKIKNDLGVHDNLAPTTSEKSASTTTSYNTASPRNSICTHHSATSTESGSSFKTTHQSHDRANKYYGEKLRLALRGYINTLLHKLEIASCKEFLRFLDDPTKNFSNLSPEQFQDYEQRMELEKMRLVTQEEFQNHIAHIVDDLRGNFEHFKKELITDPHQLSAIFVEIGQNSRPEDISPLLTSFIEWCKLEVAATFYQMFLTQDNSSQLLLKFRKFHRIFPYRLCYGILKYTNPVKIMSRIVDLLLMNAPSFGRKNNLAHNLLSMMFVMFLDEDLEDFSKERQKLLNTKPLDLPEFQVFFARIRAYVHGSDELLEEELRQEHIESDASFFLSVLSSDLIEPRLSGPERSIFEKVIKPSYESYQNLSTSEALEGASVYVTLKQFWQLEIRTRDKEILKQLWKEPELTLLIKRVLTVFYQPLMIIMKKSNVHLVFLDLQKFLDELLAELTLLDEGEVYYTSSVEMFNRFKKLLDKYEGTFYRFLHDLHNKDDAKLFLKLIAWVESFLVAIRTKFADPEKVKLDFASMTPMEDIDQEKFRKDLNTRIELILRKRFLLKSCLQNSAAADVNQTAAAPGTENQPERVLSSHQKAIDQQWENLNNGMFDMQPQELGVAGDDLEEFNLGHAGEQAADAFRGGRGNAQVLRQIAELDKLMNEVSDTEIHKLIDPVHAQIATLLGNLVNVKN